MSGKQTTDSKPNPNLTVRVLCLCSAAGKSPQIADTDGNELKGLIGPFNEGEELRLVCTTNGGNHPIDYYLTN